jgi:hypothetical protein
MPYAPVIERPKPRYISQNCGVRTATSGATLKLASNAAGCRSRCQIFLRGQDNTPIQQRNLYRVGPNCKTWPDSLTEIPYQSLKVAPDLGQPGAILLVNQPARPTSVRPLRPPRRPRRAWPRWARATTLGPRRAPRLVGLGRIVALRHRPSALYQIR